MTLFKPLKILKIVGLVGFAVWATSLSASDQPDSKTTAPNQPPAIAAEDLQFFEARIRPVLVVQCYSCHSHAASKASRLKGGLMLDSRDGLLRGGDSGPALNSREPAKSLLLEALRHESVKMPPQGKLPANVIADFERWVSRGAPDPRHGAAATTVRKGIDLEAGRQHWSFRPVGKPVVPDLGRHVAAPGSSIDAFVLSKLHDLKIDPADDADRSTLVRRVYFDLVGLPPAPEEIDEFLVDESPDAYERLVDRLLASPLFGERWGRRWLSVARFGESLTLRGMVFQEAWRYRDYVIDSFNRDRSFGRFIVEQLAGDLLPAETLEDRQRQRIATTYLTLGNVNLEEQDKRQLQMDVVDDQLDAISRGFLAQTVTCARCHDHKFDPIPTRDYYALAGILANTKTIEHANVSKWLEFPLPLEPEREAYFAQHEAVIATVRDKIKSTQDALKLLADKNPQKTVAPKIIAAKELPGIVVDDSQAKLVGDWQKSQYSKSYVGDGYLHDQNTGKGKKTITLLPELQKAGRYEVRFAYTPGDNRSDAVPVTIFSADGEKTVTVNEKQTPPIDEHFISLGQYRFELNGQGFVIVSNEGTTGHVIVDAVQFLPVDMLNGQERPISKPDVATTPPQPNPERSEQLNQELKRLQLELEQLQKNGPRRPMFMSVQEEKQIGDISIHVRGSVHNTGERVPRGFLQVTLMGTAPVAPAAQSGRRELGEWIASPDNPLTSRVLVNRIWYWLFGAGLVRTPDNFGTTGEPPTHPELLDHLVGRLLARDWSVKQVVREIVLSRTYRQSSIPTRQQRLVDPENQWLSHQNRRRLDPECLLDAILTTNGRLQYEIGGKTIRTGTNEDYGYRHETTRRAVYWPVFRNALPEIFEVFDFADPSVPTGVRHTSTVAPQALFALNDEWVTSESQFAARRFLAKSPADDAGRIDRAFRLTLGRRPTPREATLAAESLKNRPAEQGWAALFQALFATIDFRYVE